MTVAPGHFFETPHTRLGWWSVGLTSVFTLFVAFLNPISNPSTTQISFIPNLGCLMILCGLSGGIVGLIALTRQHEHSRLVWLSLLSDALSFSLLIGDFLAAIVIR